MLENRHILGSQKKKGNVHITVHACRFRIASWMQACALLHIPSISFPLSLWNELIISTNLNNSAYINTAIVLGIQHITWDYGASEGISYFLFPFSLWKSD